MTSFIQRAVGRVRREGYRLQRSLDTRLVKLSLLDHPRRSERIAENVLYRARRRLIYLLEGSNGRIEYWEGLEAETGRPLRVVYLADEKAYKVRSPQFLQSRLFQPDSVRETQGGSFKMGRIRQETLRRAHEADLLITEGNSLLRWQPPGVNEEWLRLTPTWVRMAIRFAPGQTWEEVEQGMRSQRNNLKLARRSGFTARMSTDEADFDLFYERMHVPMVRQRHADYAQIDSKDGLRFQFHQGNLLMIDDAEGHPVAGQLNLLKNGFFMGYANGYLDGDQRLFNQGVLTLIYYEAMRWAFEQGYKVYDAGGVRPFASEGLYFYKVRWGLKPADEPWNIREWMFWAPAGAPVAVDWLRAHPPIPAPEVRLPWEKTGQAAIDRDRDLERQAAARKAAGQQTVRKEPAPQYTATSTQVDSQPAVAQSQVEQPQTSQSAAEQEMGHSNRQRAGKQIGFHLLVPVTGRGKRQSGGKS